MHGTIAAIVSATEVAEEVEEEEETAVLSPLAMWRRKSTYLMISIAMKLPDLMVIKL